jgi:DNA-binding transcriptional LysR family regulator
MMFLRAYCLPDSGSSFPCLCAAFAAPYVGRCAQASRAGIGLAYVGEWTVADDIASGRLVEVLSEWTPAYPGYCLYYPGRRHMAASLRAFIDLAQKIVSRNRAKAS